MMDLGLLTGTVRVEQRGKVQELAVGSTAAARAALRSAGDDWCTLDVVVSLEEPVTLIDVALELPLAAAPITHVLANGYQSWSETWERGPESLVLPLHRFARPWLGGIGAPQSSPVEHVAGWTWAYARRTATRIELIASLDEHRGFTRIGLDAKTGRASIHRSGERRSLRGDEVVLSLLLCRGYLEDCFRRWIDLLRVPRREPRGLTGWTSWYTHATRIDEPLILNRLRDIVSHRVPFDVLQIDDGWQPAVGDWLQANGGFPRGLAPLAKDIRAAGITPGLWIAPFLCLPRSRVALSHPEWLLRDGRGRPIFVGMNPHWRSVFHALDLSRDDVRSHLRRVMQVIVEEWGFELLKLDFLFAGALTSDRGRSASQLVAALDDVVAAARPARVLACGVPLGVAIGRVDFCRTGTDMTPSWDPAELRWLHWLRFRERPATRSGIRTVLSRSSLGPASFGIDPDVFMLRAKGCRLNAEQRHTLLLLAAVTGEVLFTSDDLDGYGESEWRSLRSLFPRALAEHLHTYRDRSLHRLLFRVEGRRYELLYNDGKRPTRALCSFDRAYAVREQQIVTEPVTAYLPSWGTRLFMDVSTGTFLGSTGHMFPGCEVARLLLHGDRVVVERRPGFEGEAAVWVRVPDGTRQMRCGEHLVTTTRQAGLTVARVPLPLASTW